MRTISLTRGKFAIVDDEDYCLVNEHRWQACRGRNTWYAYGKSYGPGNPKGTFIAMHRIILGISDSNIPVDHINRNGLDNRRENLRAVTLTQNCWNSPAHKDAVSYLKGVSYDDTSKRQKRWTASIMRNGKRKNLGYFNTEQSAAKAYADAERYFEQTGNLP